MTKKTATSICIYCGKDFPVEPRNVGKRKYCSLACANEGRVGLKRSEEFKASLRGPRPKSRKERVKITCPTCSTIFEEIPSHAKRGRKYCSRACQTLAKIGVPFSQERKDNISRAKQTVSRPDSPDWQAGLSRVNTMIRNSRETAIWRDAVLKRDAYQCGFCGKVGGKIQADHILPFALYPEKRFDVNNGQTLCKECHKFKTRIDRYFYDNYSTRL